MDNLNSLDIFNLVYRKRTTLIAVVFAAAVLSFGTSFLLKEKYKSLAVIYPVNLYQNSEESNSEQLLQYLLSEDVKNQLAAEFKLYDRYGCDTMQVKSGKAMFNYAYQENFNISPTLYESIEISVKDEDPLMAKRMNERLIFLTNQLIQKNKVGIVRQYLTNAKNVLKASDAEMDSLSKRVSAIKKEYNIVDESQGKYLGKELAKSSNVSEQVRIQANGLREKGAELNVLTGKIKSTLKSYAKMKEIHDKYFLDAQGNIDFILYVSKPTLPDKRCYPVRWIIVLVSSLSALLFGAVVIIIRDRNKAN